MDDLISVVIPVFNGERFVGATLQSVLDQSHRNLEILVVDDGSTDCTRSVIEDFKARDGRIRLLTQANKGVAAARNLGIRHANARFLAPLDADDLWHQEKLSRQLRCLLDSPDSVGLVYSHSVIVDERSAKCSPCMNREHPQGLVWTRLLLGNFLGNASSCLIRTSCLAETGGYDETFVANCAQGCEDWDLYLKLAARYALRCEPTCLIAYRQVAGSMSLDVAQMLRSYECMLRNVAALGVAIPARVWRWSRGGFLQYLAERAAAAQMTGAALRLSFEAVRSDWMRILDPRLGRNLARLAIRRRSSLVPSGSRPQLSTTETWNGANDFVPHRCSPLGAIWQRVKLRREREVAAMQNALGIPANHCPGEFA